MSEQNQQAEVTGPNYDEIAKTIDYSDMVLVLAKSGRLIHSYIDSQACHILHMIMGLTGEFGELVDNDGTRENLIEELGDFEFYFEGFRQGYDVPLEEVNKFPKTFKRVTTHGQIGAVIISTSNLVDVAKKAIIYEKPIDRERLIEEMRQVRYALLSMYDANDLTLEEIQHANKRKLAKRYEGFQYSNAAAQKRADKAE